MKLKIVKKITDFLSVYYIPILGFGLLLSFFVDRETALEVSEDEHAFLRELAHYITDVALGVYWISGSLLMILFVTLLMKNSKSQHKLQRLLNLRSWALHLLLAILSTGTVVMVLKFLIGRGRPIIWNDSLHVFSTSPFNLNTLYQSFPSGHTQVIFCVGTMLGYLWPRRRIEFLAIAVAIALTRVLTMKHFISDVYVGMLIGAFGCKASVNFWSKWVAKPEAIEGRTKIST